VSGPSFCFLFVAVPFALVWCPPKATRSSCNVVS
jgi:hypothetical protein